MRFVYRCERPQASAPFSVYQGRWSAADRDFEREILPMARAEGMALAPWGALARRAMYVKALSLSEASLTPLLVKTDAQREAKEGRKSFRPTGDKHIAISKKLEAIAEKKNTIITSVALAYVMHTSTLRLPDRRGA